MTDWENSGGHARRRWPLAAAAGVALTGLIAAVVSVSPEGGNGTPPDGRGLAVDYDAEPPPRPDPADDLGGEGENDERATEGSPDPDLDPIGEWRPLARSPLPPGDVAGSAWTGEELLVWGGKADEFAAYDPDRDQWRRAADAPVYATGATGVVWTGEELVVMGAYEQAGQASVPIQGAAYRPGTDEWRPIATAPEGDWSWDAAVWDGTAIVVLGARFSLGAEPRAIAYVPEDDTWRDLPPPPVWNWSGRLLAAEVDGRVMAIGERPSLRETGERELTAYDRREEAWSPPEQTPYGGLWSVGVAARDRADHVAVIGAVHDDVWHDVTATWSPREGLRWDALPPRPFSGQHAPSLVDTGHGLIAWPPGTDEAWLLDEAEGAWRPLASGPLGPRRDHALAWTGQELLVWGGRTGLRPLGDGAAWRATSPASPP